MKINLFIFLLVSAMFIPGLAIAQQSTVAAEGNATGLNGSVSYSIGQIVYTSHAASSGNINQGVQQPFDVMIVSTSEIGDAFSTSIYPNPASTAIHLQIDPDADSKYHVNELSYTLTDMNGRYLKHDDIVANSTMVPVEDLTEAVYFLHIQYRHENIKTFKIVKTNQQ